MDNLSLLDKLRAATGKEDLCSLKEKLNKLIVELDALAIKRNNIIGGPQRDKLSAQLSEGEKIEAELIEKIKNYPLD